jgi:DNA-binding CsgD family transcriptional regulator
VGAGEIAFVHPLARSAAYAAATAAERRAGHRAHAQALADRDEERRAWHLGAASDGYDETAAEALERAGAVATRRGQHGVAAAALHRAARLTEPLELRARRLLAAAQSMESTSMPTQVTELLEEALTIAEDSDLRATLVAQSALTPSGRPYTERLRRARRAAFGACADDPGLAVRALREAVAAASALCQPTTVRRLGVVAVARAAEKGDPALRAVAEVSLAWGYSFEGRPGDAAAALERAAELLGRLDLATLDVWPTNAGLNRHLLLGDSVGGRALAGQVMELARARGQSFLLVRALDHATIFDLALGEWDRAAHEADELLTLAQALGAPGSSWWRYMPTVCNALEALAILAALRGDPETPRLVDEWGTIAAETELGDHDLRLQPALATFELALGDHESCVSRLEALDRRRRQLGMWEPQFEAAPLLVEAYASMGRTTEARAALERLHTRLDRYTSPTLRAQAARAAALLAPEDGYEQAFDAALELHDANVGPFERARTLLLLGERRRRSGCMLAAREPLRSAARTFGRLRAQAWLERAQAELLATGEKRRSSRRAVELTPQERRIADLACEGRTNREIASALFLSPKTVEYHLGNAYRKLGVRSRTELARRLSR